MNSFEDKEGLSHFFLGDAEINPSPCRFGDSS